MPLPRIALLIDGRGMTEKELRANLGIRGSSGRHRAGEAFVAIGAKA